MGAASPAAILGGTVYEGSTDGKLYALSAPCLAAGGGSCVRWSSAATGGAVSSAPALGGGRAFVGSADGRLYAFPSPCAALWSAPTGGAVMSSASRRQLALGDGSSSRAPRPDPAALRR